MRHEPELPEITFGENICRKLKTMFYPSQPWDMPLAKAIASMLLTIKKKAPPYFMGDDRNEMLRKISHYNRQDLQEMCDVIGLMPEDVKIKGNIIEGNVIDKRPLLEHL